MTLSRFRRWLKEHVRWCRSIGDVDEVVAVECASIIDAARGHALGLGLVEAADACRCRADMIGPAVAAECLAAALASLPAARGSKEKPPAAENASLTVSQVATRLSVSAKCVYELCQSGRLKHQRIGKGRGTIRIRPADLAAFEQSSRSTGLVDEGSLAAKRRRHLSV